MLEQRRSTDGALSARDRHASILAERIAGWDDTDILLCGPVGGRAGWLEMPYVPCPAGVADIAAGLRLHQAPELPGVACGSCRAPRTRTATVPAK